MGQASRRKWIRRWWREETGFAPTVFVRLMVALTRGMRRGAARMRVAVAAALGGR